MKEVEVQFNQSGQFKVKSGMRIHQIMQNLNEKVNSALGARVNNKLTSLSYKIEVNSKIELVYPDSRDGVRFFRSSLCFLLGMAAMQEFPDRPLVISHSIGDAYFYYFEDSNSVTEEETAKLDTAMQEFIRADLPIKRILHSYCDALELLKHKKRPQTELLLLYRNESKIPFYICNDYFDLAHAPLVASCGCLKPFELRSYRSGLLLRFPSMEEPDKIQEFRDNPLLYRVYREHQSSGAVCNVTCAAELNKLMEKGSLESYIQLTETLQEKKIAQIADQIAAKKEKPKVILIAGPSSSGKTTFSKKLALQLQLVGFDPVNISLDDYFLDREKTPLDENGNYDFETIKALDTLFLNQQLLSLFNGEEIELPLFDFKLGKRRKSGKCLKLGPKSILVLEGIHALNDELTPQLKADWKYKIYVSALTQLNLDDHNRISTTDNRLLRRMVRDYKFRGHSALNTLKMWPSVGRGEKKHIFPFQNTADSVFNSALNYELGVLKVFAEPLLKTVKPIDPQYSEAIRLLSFLNNFNPVPAGNVPLYSMLREFIGQSGFKY